MVGVLGAVLVGATGYHRPRRTESRHPDPAQVNPGPAPGRDVLRRTLLTGTVLGVAGAAGSALQARDRPSVSATVRLDVVTLTDYVDHVVDRPDRADRSTWDWTPALRAALTAAALDARISNRIEGTQLYRRTGLPSLDIPRGTFRLTGTVALHYLHGLTVTGAGRDASVLIYEGADVLFDIHRSSALTFAGLAIAGRHPAESGTEGIQGLREGSCAFRITERSTDVNQSGGNTYMANFNGLEVSELHYAFAFVGDQMTDGMIWTDLRLRDNFIDFDYANGNSVNHQVFGCEVLYGVSHPEASYARRLKLWSQPRDLRDGASLNVSTGGDVSFFGGSFIVRKPTIAFATPPQDSSQGAVSNVAGYSFFATRWELRDRDPGTDEAGLQRTTLVRWSMPGATNYLVQPTLRFDACRFVVLVEDLDLLYVVNLAAISWTGCRVFPPTRGRLVSLVNAATAKVPGSFLAEASTMLPVVRRLIGAAGMAVDQVIEMSASGSPDVSQGGGSPTSYSTLVSGRSVTARRVLFRAPSGNLLDAGQAELRTTVQVQPGALLRQIGAVMLDPTSQQVSVQMTADGRPLGTLLLRPEDARPYRVVEEFTESGAVQVVASRRDAEAVRGYLYVEYF